MNFKVNINENVKVKLTDKGIDILRKGREEINQMMKDRGAKGLGEYELKVDEEGYTTFLLWDLMTTFAPHMHMGLDLPFETNVIMTNGTPVDSWLINEGQTNNKQAPLE